MDLVTDKLTESKASTSSKTRELKSSYLLISSFLIKTTQFSTLLDNVQFITSTLPQSDIKSSHKVAQSALIMLEAVSKSSPLAYNSLSCLSPHSSDNAR